MGADATVPYFERWTRLRCLSLHAALVVAVIVIYLLGTPAGTLLFAGPCVATCFFFFVWLEAKQTTLKITPISVYFLWQGFALGVAAVYIGTEIFDGSSLYLGVRPLAPEYVAKGYLIGLIGTLPLHAGLQWLRPKSVPLPLVEVWQVKRLLPKLLFFFFLGIFVLTFNRQLVFLGSVVTIFQFAAHGALIAFVLLPSNRLGMPEYLRLGFLIAGTAMLMLAATRSSSKLYLMQAMVGLFFYVLQRKNLRRHVPAAVLVLLFIYLTIVAPTVNEARSIEITYRVSHADAQIEAFKKYSPLYTGRFDVEFYRHQIERLLSRQFEASSIALIAQEVDTKGYIYGEIFYQIRYFFIPRAFWPDKPYMVKGAWFTHYLGGSARESESTTANGMEAAGELYWSFGILGVLIGMLVLGAMFGGLWRMAGTDPRMEPLRMSLYMLNAITLMNLPEAASRMTSCLTIMLLFGVLLFLLRPYRQGRTVVFHRPQFSE